MRRVESTVERRVMDFEETLVVVSYEEEGKLKQIITYPMPDVKRR